MREKDRDSLGLTFPILGLYGGLAVLQANCVVMRLESEWALHEGQAGFR